MVPTGVRCLLAFLLLATFAFAAAPSADLEALKAQFPPHVAGPVTDKSDAVTQRYFFKYQAIVKGLTPDTVAAQALRMRESAAVDLSRLESIQRNDNKTYDSNTRAAARKSAVWIRERLMPYLGRLAQFQRGR
jgi:hypothetical protein